MGFMDALKQVVGIAAPIVGGVFGGPAGAAIGTAVAGAINKKKPPTAMPGGAAIALPGFVSGGPAYGLPTGGFIPGPDWPSWNAYMTKATGRQFGSSSGAGIGGFGGASGSFGRRYRRMNPGNAKAARRAIRRIKSVRKLLKGIESQLPRRPCKTPFRRRR